MDSPCRTPCQCACERHLKVLRLLPRQAVIPSSRPHCQLAIHIDQIRAVTTNQNTADGLEAPAQGLPNNPPLYSFHPKSMSPTHPAPHDPKAQISPLHSPLQASNRLPLVSLGRPSCTATLYLDMAFAGRRTGAILMEKPQNACT